jgi:hypothetical protein
MRIPKSVWTLAVVVALILGACGRVARPPLPRAEGAGGGEQTSLPDGAALVADNSLVVGSVTYRLGATAGAPLIGALAPLAVPSPDGSQYLYNAWAQGADVACSGDPAARGNCKNPAPDAVFGRPTLRVFTPASSRDTVLEIGAMSAAWRADGAIAYFKGNANDVPADAARFVGHLYVRPSLQAAPVRLTTAAARYIAVAWAGNTLIAYRQSEGERFDVLAIDEPGNVRTLAADSTLVAVSPDGTQLVVNHDVDGTSMASVVTVAGGVVSSTLDLGNIKDAQTASAVAWVTYAGSWDGDLVAAESANGIALFRVRSGRISFDSMLVPRNNDYPMGIHEPQLFHETKSGKLDLIAWAPLNAPTNNGRVQTIVTCSMSDKSCKRDGNRDERAVGIAHGRNGRKH